MENGWLRRLVSVGGLALAFTLVTSGCIMRPGPGGDPNNPSSGGGGAAIVVRNNSSTTICYVNFSSTASNDWGGDQLGSETIAAGASHSWPVSPGTYDVRLQDCDHGTLAERRGVAVNGATDVTLP